MAKDVPLKLIKPELVVMQLSLTKIPATPVVPFAIVPVIVTLPAPVVEILAVVCMRTPVVPDVPFAIVPMIVTLPALEEEMSDEDCIQTPDELWSMAHEVPLIVIEPEMVVTFAPFAKTPFALIDPLPLTPVTVTQPDPPACTFDDVRFTPAQAVFSPPRPSITIFPLAVFTFTVEPLMQTPWNEPV